MDKATAPVCPIQIDDVRLPTKAGGVGWRDPPPALWAFQFPEGTWAADDSFQLVHTEDGRIL